MTNYGRLMNNARRLLKQKEIDDGRDYSFQEIGKAIGASASTVSRIVNEPETNMSNELVKLFCWFLKCTPGDFLTYIPDTENDA